MEKSIVVGQLEAEAMAILTGGGPVFIMDAPDCFEAIAAIDRGPNGTVAICHTEYLATTKDIAAQKNLLSVYDKKRVSDTTTNQDLPGRSGQETI